MTHELTHLDLFSGIGGFALAAGRAGFRTVGFSEVEPYACRVLEHRWPGVPNIGDVRKSANFARFHGTTAITGGFPCQPWSLAGKQGGHGDDRHLWPAMLGVIQVVRPAWIIGENVPGLDHLGQLDACCDDLESIGYDTQSFEIPACAVDAPHLRNRIWIVAYADRSGIRHESESIGGRGGETQPFHDSPARSNPHPAGDPVPQLHVRAEQSEFAAPRRDDFERLRPVVADTKEQHRPFAGCETSLAGRRGEIVADTDAAGRGRPGNAHPGKGAGAAGLGPAQHGGRDFSDLERSGLRDGRWLPEPAVGRVAHGIPNRSHRIKGLGNAIVPQIPEAILGWIAQIERGELTELTALDPAATRAADPAQT